MLTWVEISRSSVLSNVRQFSSIIGSAGLHCVVKSNAYGHGVPQLTSILNGVADVSGFMVVSLDEAMQLLALTKKPVSILSFWQKDHDHIRMAVRHGIIFPLYTISDAIYLDKLGKQFKKKIKVQIKVDVGTMRLGFRADQALTEIIRISKLTGLDIRGVYSHFADSENSNQSFTRSQAEKFMKLIIELHEKGLSFTMNHISCSASSMRHTAYHFHAIRLGLGLYGLWPSQATKRALLAQDIVLQPVLTWKTRVIQIKNIEMGESVGYSMSYKTKKKCKIAVIPVGYWDGYDRLLSNKGKVIIGGKLYPVRGRVCMNMSMIELPYASSIKVGTEVILLGSRDGKTISAEDIAHQTHTINYEIVTRINPHISRIVTQ